MTPMAFAKPGFMPMGKFNAHTLPVSISQEKRRIDQDARGEDEGVGESQVERFARVIGRRRGGRSRSFGEAR